MKITRPNINLLLFIVVMFSIGSCNVSKHLGDEQYLVKKNKIIIDDKAYSKHDNDLLYNLESLIQQKPNRDYFFIPRELLYFRNKEAFESGKNKKGWVKNAERPVIHADGNMFATAEQMEKYLRFSKGYYNAKVYPKAFLSDKKAEIHYYVTTELGYTIRSKEYFSDDERIMALINSFEEDSKLKPGTHVDETIFDAEKNWIAQQLQERGFANFGTNNIDFKADSSNYQMDVFITILPPVNDSIHRKYTIGKINVYPDYGVSKEDYTFNQTLDSIHFLYHDANFFVKPNTLERAIQFRTGNLYKKSNLDNSYTAISKLGTFRYIKINTQISPIADTIIDYNILLTPISNPWAREGSLDLFYSYFIEGAQRIGVGASGSINNINAFGGGEKFRIGAEILGENSLDSLQFTNFTAKIETGLTYPTVIDPFKSVWLLRKVGFITPKHYTKFKNKTISDTELSYSYQSWINQYLLHSIKGDFRYEYSPESKIKILYTLFNINSISANVNQTFQDSVLSKNILFAKSLEPTLITGFVLQGFEYRVNNPVFSNGFTWGANIRLEQSGMEVAVLNSIINRNDEWVINLNSGNKFRFSKYLLADITFRAEQKITEKHRIAARMRGGLAGAFGQDAVIPFIKQFYVGGGNSLRGWNFRELGPGGYSEEFLDPSTTGNNFFQSGDIVLEANIEYRFPLYYLFEGAVFIDAGNVWSLQEDINRPDAQFLWNQFYNQIAVSYGLGLRMNLDFIVLRFDFGQKLRYPFKYAEIGNRYWERPEFTLDYLNKVNFSFGLNYPF